MISYAIVALLNLLARLCCAELSARLPKAGSLYRNVNVITCRFIAFLVGFFIVLEYSVRIASIANGITRFIKVLLNKEDYEYWIIISSFEIPYIGIKVDFFAFGIVIASSILM